MTSLDLSDEPLERAAVDWTEFSLCKGKLDIFFGPPGERPSKRRKREALARSYCQVCAVADICKQIGRQNHESGIWGGENEEERARAGYPPRGAVRRSISAAAREGRQHPTDDELIELLATSDRGLDESVDELADLPPLGVL